MDLSFYWNLFSIKESLWYCSSSLFLIHVTPTSMILYVLSMVLNKKWTEERRPKKISEDGASLAYVNKKKNVFCFEVCNYYDISKYYIYGIQNKEI